MHTVCPEHSIGLPTLVFKKEGHSLVAVYSCTHLDFILLLVIMLVAVGAAVVTMLLISEYGREVVQNRTLKLSLI